MLDPTLADTLNLIADIAALVAFAGMLVFTLLYSSFYQWRRRKAGKSVLFLALSFVSVILVSILALWIGPDFWLRPIWRTAAWLFAAFSVGYLLYALIYNWQDRHPIEIEAKTGPTLLDSGPGGE